MESLRGYSSYTKSKAAFTRKLTLFLAASCGVLLGESGRADLVAHWSFEEGSGTTTRDLVGMRDDPLMDLMWVTDVPDGAAGNFSLQFNGATSVIDTGYEGIGGDTPRTMLAWIRLAEVTDSAASQSIFTYGGRGGNGAKWHVRINDGGSPRVPGAIRTEAQGGNQTGTTNLADGLWHHVASVFPGGPGSDNTDVIHYVDGRLEGQTGTTDEPINTVIGPDVPAVSIGARRQGGNSPPDGTLSSYFNGLMHEVRFYDEALSLEQIKDIAGPLPPMQINGFEQIDVNNTLRFGAAAENVVTGSATDPTGAVFAQVFDVGNQNNLDANRATTENNVPFSEGVMPAPIFWPGSNGGQYPEVFGFDPGVNREQYTVKITGEMLIEQNGEIIFKDGVDDFTAFHIDTDGDGTLDEVINDNTWTNEFGVNNGGSPLSPAEFTNVPAEGAWRPFEFLMAEGGGGDSGALAWNFGAAGEGFPASNGDAFSMSNLVPGSHLRAPGETVDDATVSFDAVLRLSEVAGGLSFDVNVEQLKWDKIGMTIPSQVGNNTPDNATLDLDGVAIHLNLLQDPTPGLTVDLIDNAGITEIVGTPTFRFSHGDPADWDTSQFLITGQLTFGGGPPMMGIAGDYNGNGTVEQADLDLVLLNWGESFENLPAEWVNQRPTEGIVAQAQLDGVLLNWGNMAAVGAVAGVPEPGSMVLLLVASGFALGRRWFGKRLAVVLTLLACVAGLGVQTSPAQVDIGGAGSIREVFIQGEQQNNVEEALPNNGLGFLFAERYSNPRPQFDNWENVQNYVANNDPVASGIIEAPPIWDNADLATYPYPPALGFPQIAQDQYGVRIFGEILIPDGEPFIDFRDGVDDHTVFIVDELGDGSLDDDIPIIEDTTWTSLDGTGNAGGNYGIGNSTASFLGVFSNVEPGGSWRMFELTMSEGGGGDRISLAWSVGDTDGSFSPAFNPANGFSLEEGNDLVPGDHFRAPGGMQAVSFDSVLNFTSGANFDVDVEELAWDRVASEAHVTTADVNYVVDFSGGVLSLNLNGDPPPGFTVDLVDDSVNVDEIRAPAEYSFSHGDPALWDTSNFTTNGQIRFGTAAQLLAGDYNGNGQIEQADMDLVLLNWGQSASDLPQGWVTSVPTGSIDQDELDAVLLNWGAGGLSTAGVPEPSTVAILLVVAGLGFGLVRRR